MVFQPCAEGYLELVLVSALFPYVQAQMGWFQGLSTTSLLEIWPSFG